MRAPDHPSKKISVYHYVTSKELAENKSRGECNFEPLQLDPRCDVRKVTSFSTGWLSRDMWWVCFQTTIAYIYSALWVAPGLVVNNLGIASKDGHCSSRLLYSVTRSNVIHRKDHLVGIILIILEASYVLFDFTWYTCVHWEEVIGGKHENVDDPI